MIILNFFTRDDRAHGGNKVIFVVRGCHGCVCFGCRLIFDLRKLSIAIFNMSSQVAEDLFLSLDLELQLRCSLHSLSRLHCAIF